MLAIVLAAVLSTGATTTTNNNYVLDAAEKHIVRAQFHEDEAVALSGNAAGGWHLYAGAAIDAQRIDLTMHDIKGSVRFRADWSRVRSVLDRVEQQNLARRKQ